jgi:hypothetical protein
MLVDAPAESHEKLVLVETNCKLILRINFFSSFGNKNIPEL